MTGEKKQALNRLILSAIFLAAGLVLPFITGGVPVIGNLLLPMHLPVLLCGFVCGGAWGLAVGFVLPLLRGALFGMPPMFPAAIAMAFELAAYGLSSGLLSRSLPKNAAGTYFSLICAMLIGRVVWGLVMSLLTLAGAGFSPALFLSGAFTMALPGILLQLVIIPPLVMAIWRSKEAR